MLFVGLNDIMYPKRGKEWKFMKRKSRSAIRPLLMITLCIFLIFAVIAYFAYPYILQEYNYYKLEEHSAVVTSADDLAALDIYPNLSRLDVRGSDCYAEILSYMAANPHVEVTYDVALAGQRWPMETASLELADGSFTMDELLNNLAYLPEMKNLSLPFTTLRVSDLEQLKEAYPDVTLSYTVNLLNEEFSPDITFLDLSGVQPEELETVLIRLEHFPAVTEIELMNAEGVSALGLTDVKQIMDAIPGAAVNYSFDLFGQTVTTSQERVEFINQYIGNEGIDTIRQALDILPNCTYFLMDTCGVDNEVMAQLREDYAEQTKVVWRVWLVRENYNSRLYLRCGSYLTDTHRIRTTYVTDENSHVLNYCTETKYVDVGHVWALTQCEFLAYMPDLEVCILAITNITDISPLANHDKLEYLELFTTDISDISPLITCPNIEHLNLSNMPLLDDITPVFTLTKLKRLRMVDSPLISKEEKQQAEEALPNCAHLNIGHYATAWGWRYDDGQLMIINERYALLCEQMEYEKDAKEYGIP